MIFIKKVDIEVLYIAIALNAKLKFKFDLRSDASTWEVRTIGVGDVMTKLAGYCGLKVEGDIKRIELGLVGICRRRMDVDG